MIAAAAQPTGNSTRGARAAVLGHPIGHSRSPLLHSTAYRAMGVSIDYTAIDIEPGEAEAFAARLRTEPEWVGVSVTMPMKDALIPYMDELSGRVQRLGALNTVLVRRTADGVHLVGHNTDVDGIVRSLAPALRAQDDVMVTGTPRRAAILGAGNTALAALEACADLGFTHVDLVVRNPERATAARTLATELGLSSETISAKAAGERLRDYAAVISTLPARAADGLVAQLGLAGSAGILAPGAVLLDVAYDPWPSAIASAWHDAGGTVVSGMLMLVHQGVEQVKMFSGVKVADWKHVTNVMCDAVGLSRP